MYMLYLLWRTFVFQDGWLLFYHGGGGGRGTGPDCRVPGVGRVGVSV